MKVEVRPADWGEITLLERAFPDGPSDKHSERLMRQQMGLGSYLIAWHEGRPVGHGLLKWEGAAEAPMVDRFHGTCPDVEDLFVLEDYRSQGVGTQILNEAERRVLARGFMQIGLSVDVRNPRARALYERLGYRDAGLGIHHEHGEYTDVAGQRQEWDDICIYLVKPLSAMSGT